MSVSRLQTVVQWPHPHDSVAATTDDVSDEAQQERMKHGVSYQEGPSDSASTCVQVCMTLC